VSDFRVSWDPATAAARLTSPVARRPSRRNER
jgi:hypothetical protein